MKAVLQNRRQCGGLASANKFIWRSTFAHLNLKANLMVLRQKSLTSDPVLTPREKEILEFVAQGLSTKEVAQQIDIAPRTVDRHVENARLKLRAKNRAHMIAYALIAGLIQIDGDDVEETF